MKINFYTLVLLLVIPFINNAQLNNFNVGDVAPDFTVTDIHGQSHQAVNSQLIYLIVLLKMYK